MKRHIFLVLVIIFLELGGYFYINRNDFYINHVLSSKAYKDLPMAAKNYIKNVYNKTGKVILTENNKKENKTYLNPQYIDYLTLSNKEKRETASVPSAMVLDYTNRTENQDLDLPKQYDLRDVEGKNYVSPVRDQGKLGLCWAFSTAGAMESHLLKTNDKTYDNSSLLISERQLDYATSKNGIIDYDSEYVSFVDRYLGQGGNFYISTVAMASGISLLDYNSFKEYSDSDMNKMELFDVLNYDNSLYEVNETVNIPRLNLRNSTSVLTLEEKKTKEAYLKTIKENIIKNGASYVATYMNSSCYYEDDNGNTVVDVYNCPFTGSHALEIIGYDDDFEYSYCADTNSHVKNTEGCKEVVTGKGAWLLKNSWGNDTKYPYLTYDSLYSDISFIKNVSSSNSKTWDNNYVLDNYEENTINEGTYDFKNTKLRKEEKLKKIKFVTMTQDTIYKVRVYKSDGTYEDFSKKVALPGLVTYDIDKDIDIDSNSKIVISSEGEFLDKVLVFTANTDKKYAIDTIKKNIKVTDEKVRLYAETKNIIPNQVVNYKLYDSSNNDVSSKITITNNIVAENNVNTLATFDLELANGSYKLEAIYNDEVLDNINVEIAKMEGKGTKSDPYVITNGVQLSQIRNDLDGYYVLANDIDLTEETKNGGSLSLSSGGVCPDDFGFEAINDFSGTLDGQGHTIKGLHQKNYVSCFLDNEENYLYHNFNNLGNGLFGRVKGNVTIKNLVLDSFDVGCYRSGSSVDNKECGLLVSKYIANMDSYGNIDYDDKNEYKATFENIVVVNSKIEDVDNHYLYIGGLFGSLTSLNGKIDISNIYTDVNFSEEFSEYAYLAHEVYGNDVNIQNIQLTGNLTAKPSAPLIYRVSAFKPTMIKNVISTVTGDGMNSDLFGTINGEMLTVKNVNLLKATGNGICPNNSCPSSSDVNIYDKNTQLTMLTDKSNYSTWDLFDDNFVMKSVDGVPRIPVLKFMNFEYTKIPDIVLKQELNKKVSIFDYLSPKKEAAKRISYKSNDKEIIDIDEEGWLLPKKSGKTSIHVESLYDGYIKDVPIEVSYVPHYNINFDANSGSGVMDSVEVSANSDFTLPANTFTKKYYVFNGWNTKSDGSGVSYSDLDVIKGLDDKEEITLYAQWLGEERIVTFDPNGGEVDPTSKVVNYGGVYGDLPIPTKENSGFVGWESHLGNGATDVDSTSKVYGYLLKALWRSDAYTLIYDGNGGKLKNNYEKKDTLKVMANDIVTTYCLKDDDSLLVNNLYEKEGYTFKEWNTKSDGSGESYQSLDQVDSSNLEKSTLRLFAIWEKSNGHITYVANNGSTETRSQEIEYGTDVKLDKNTFTNSGYIFKKWNTTSDGSGKSYSDEEVINITKDITLYAIWNPSYDYKIKEYKVDITNKYISNIKVDTTLEEFLDHIELNKGYTIAVDIKAINNKKVLYTGSKTHIFRDNDPYITYTNVVIGDINGDGAINSADLLKIRQHLLKTNTLTGIYFLASDVNYDNTINSADLLRVRQHLLKIKEID